MRVHRGHQYYPQNYRLVPGPLLWQNGAHDQEHTEDKPLQRGSPWDDRRLRKQREPTCGLSQIVVDGKERAAYASVPTGPVFRPSGVLEFLAANEPTLYRIEVTDF